MNQWDLPEYASWPKAAPTPDCEAILFVRSDGVMWEWTKYTYCAEGNRASFRWCTDRLSPDELQSINADNIDPMSRLRGFLPPCIQEFFFGASDPCNYDPHDNDSPPSVVERHRAFRTAALRAVPIINVYVLMDTDEQLRALSFLLSHMPVQVYRLSAADFMLRPLKCEPGIEEPFDRLAAAVGGLTGPYHRLPAMIIHAGPDAVSVTAVSTDFTVSACGTTEGITGKVWRMSNVDSNGHQPTTKSILMFHLHLHEVGAQVKQAGSPLPVRGTSTTEQLLGSALTEMAGFLTRTVSRWKEDAEKDLENARRNPAFTDENLNSKLAVVVGGSDAQFVEDLLASNHSSLIHPTVLGHPVGGFEVHANKSLIFLGVKSVVVEQRASLMKICQASAEDHYRWTTVGCRIAKFVDGRGTLRGTVVSVTASDISFKNDLYHVVFDTGYREDFDLMLLLDQLQLYIAIGEEWKENDPVKQGKLASKKQQSYKAALCQYYVMSR